VQQLHTAIAAERQTAAAVEDGTGMTGDHDEVLEPGKRPQILHGGQRATPAAIISLLQRL
jgi:hypothetical protein